MTLSEFKAWFEGFTESMEGAPTADQFAKIKAKVEKIDGTVTTYPIFVDRWWPRDYVVRDYYSRPYWGIGTIGLGDGNVTGTTGYQHLGAVTLYNAATQAAAFDSHAAMRDLGRAEAVN